MTIFAISDTHFGHWNTCAKFKTDGGVPLRPFASVEEMNEFMIARWNETVRPSDKVYHLGDVAIRRNDIAIVGRLNGHKRLVPGNHDLHPLKYYAAYFEAIYGSRVLNDMIFTHIPIHPRSVKRWVANVHGHTHLNPANVGPEYVNVSVEAIDYRPKSLEEIRVMANTQLAAATEVEQT